LFSVILSVINRTKRFDSPLAPDVSEASSAGHVTIHIHTGSITSQIPAVLKTQERGQGLYSG